LEFQAFVFATADVISSLRVIAGSPSNDDVAKAYEASDERRFAAKPWMR
jgi:hypothetical protein